MIFLTILFSLFITIYLFFTLYIGRGLLRKTREIAPSKRPTVAIIVAARNEEAHLPLLLEDLCHQNYPGELLEIRVADDRSTDDTWSVIQQFQRKYPFLNGLRIREPNRLMTGKKNALTQCIRKTQAPIILQTDADCRVGPEWVESMALSVARGAGLVVGYSGRVPDKSFMGRYEALDYLTLNAANFGVLLNGKAWSGSGTNLGFLRTAFTDIRGFEPIAGSIGDDDIYLVQTIANHPKYSVEVNLDRQCWVHSTTDTSFSGFFNQRVRWASTARGMEKRAPLFWFFLVSAFLSNIALLLGPFFAIKIWFVWALLKFLGDLMVTGLAARRFGLGHLLMLFPLWFCLQPIYIPMVAIFGLLGRFRWKPA